MKLGIMQPYFLPYIGYWQLMNAVDKYVVYDDVNFIKRGWINRNRIVVNNEPAYINLPIEKGSQNKKINEIYICRDDRFINAELRKIKLSYAKTPFYEDIYPLCEEIFLTDSEKLVDVILNSFKIINEYLDIHTELILSSELHKQSELKGEEKIINICECLQATTYINAIGGRDLYSKQHFKDKNIKLAFLKTKEIVYKQKSMEFIPSMSILDILMNVSKDEIKQLLDRYELIDEENI